MKFYATSQLSPKQHLTPEGYLVCEDVPVARVGDMQYLPHECGLPAGSDGIVHITRTADDLFRPETMASFVGKPVTLGHPPRNLRVADARSYSHGHIMNPRPGDGTQAGWLLCDLLLTTPEAVRAVRDQGIRQISLGYDAHFFPTDPPERGRGVQRNIIGNHAAILPDGRCGETCAVGDSAMATDAPRSIWDSFKTFLTGDPEQMARDNFRRMIEEAAAVAVRDALPATNLADRVAVLEVQLVSADARLVAAETALAEARGVADAAQTKAVEAFDAASRPATPPAPANPAQTSEIAPTAEEWQATVSRAELVAPGYRPAVMDASASPREARDALCGVRRGAFIAALETESGRALLAPFGVKDAAGVAELSCPALTMAFIGASEAARMTNNAGVISGVKVADGRKPARLSGRELNERNAAYWAKQSGAQT